MILKVFVAYALKILKSRLKLFYHAVMFFTINAFHLLKSITKPIAAPFAVNKIMKKSS